MTLGGLFNVLVKRIENNFWQSLAEPSRSVWTQNPEIIILIPLINNQKMFQTKFEKNWQSSIKEEDKNVHFLTQDRRRWSESIEIGHLSMSNRSF